MTVRTLGSDRDNVSGRTTFEWLPGGFFFQQRISLYFAGIQIESLELVGYDPETGTFHSTVYSNLARPDPASLIGGPTHGTSASAGTPRNGGPPRAPGRCPRCP